MLHGTVISSVINMFRLLAACAVSPYITMVWAQPTACLDDSQCSSGFYCQLDSRFCRECLSCEDLKRNPKQSISSCIKSVTDCGSCIKGLVENVVDGLNAECVMPDARDDGDAVLPPYVWAAIVIGLLLFVCVVLIVIYVLRNTYTFKILASTRTSVQSCRNGVSVPASAPELPPPYNAHYMPVRPDSPPPPPPPAHPAYPARHSHAPPPLHPAPPHHEDSSWPFMKSAGAEGDGSESGSGSGGARVSAGSQAACVYNNPAYVRAPQLPPSYDNTALSDESEREMEFTVHDEDTMESIWTPNRTTDHGDTNANWAVSGVGTSETSVAGGAALAPPEGPPPAAHSPLCLLQDTNNNRNPSDSSLGRGESSGTTHNAPSFFINVVQNINTVQQHNAVS